MELDALVPVALGMWAVHDKEGFDDVKAQLRQWAKRDPIDALMTTVVGGGIAFWLAERDTNPHCKTAWDGILYMSTSLSVGYDNLFPTTPTGHALATFAQTFGPAMANAALEEPGPSVDDKILAKLEEIATLLAARGA
ncbi:MAG TPA: hypothetical protein VL463_09350 [Kofleriaceae bacterium]|jgi:hypothetical protein|nr:hypothetical protein [Kofleriaceae bacterium]